MMENYSLVVEAVVIRAVQDFKIYSRILKRDPTNLDAIRIMGDVKRFFRSQWFSYLTGMDGSYLLAKLEGEEAKRPKRARAGQNDKWR
jgi:hypothetical protein